MPNGRVWGPMRSRPRPRRTSAKPRPLLAASRQARQDAPASAPPGKATAGDAQPTVLWAEESDLERRLVREALRGLPDPPKVEFVGGGAELLALAARRPRIAPCHPRRQWWRTLGPPAPPGPR